MAEVHIKVSRSEKGGGDEPKNPFKGILGHDEPDGDEGAVDEGPDYEVSPEEITAAGAVREAIDSGSDEELAKALCGLIELHGGGGSPIKKLLGG